MKKGFSLIEMLVVISVFAILGVIVTQSLSSSLKGARKSESIGYVRENVDYILNTVERTLRRTKSASYATSGLLTYTLVDNTQGTFECVTSGSDVYFRWNASNLNNSGIELTSCILEYFPPIPGVPAKVNLSLTAKSKASQGAEGSTYSSNISVSLRNYSGN